MVVFCNGKVVNIVSDSISEIKMFAHIYGKFFVEMESVSDDAICNILQDETDKINDGLLPYTYLMVNGHKIFIAIMRAWSTN